MSNASTPGPLVLVIEDEAAVRKFVGAALTGSGYRLVEASTGSAGVTEARTRSPDLILLDLGLPDMDGLQVTKSLREWSAVPIIVISARGQEKDKVDALDAGADDYLTKPFGTAELLARLRANLRRPLRALGSSSEPMLAIGGLRVDLEKRQVFRDDEEIHLTRTEYKLLVELLKNTGKVLTHRHLLVAVWGPGHAHETHYLRVYMAQLRRKLEKDHARPRYLVTEPGVGYRVRSG